MILHKKGEASKIVGNDKNTPYYICALISIAFLTLYSMVNHWPMERAIFPLTDMENNIPYIDWSYVVYLSAFIQAFIVIRLMPYRLWPTYIFGPAVAMIVGVIFFILYPIEYPRHLFPESNEWINYFRSLDMPGNCFPSLHVTMTILFAHIYNSILRYNRSINREDKAKRQNAGQYTNVKSSLMWLWTILIVVSVLTTKQHYMMDVFGGITLSAFIIFIMNIYMNRDVTVK